jgi:DNA ligase-1
MPFDMLYKKDSNGSIRTWEIWVERVGTSSSGDDIYHIKTRSGVEGSENMVEPEPQYVTEGRQNRTIAQQAQSEAQSKWLRKLDEGYKLTRASAITEINILPMLAKKFSKAARHIEYPAAGQRKFDGVRCLAMSAEGFPSNIVLLTRKNKEFAGMNSLRSEIALLNLPPSIVLDGELYSDTLTFQRVSGLVRKKPENLSERDLEDLEQVSYRIYDLINLSNMDMTFAARYRLLQSLLRAVPSSQTPRLRLTRNVRIRNEEDVAAYLALFEEEGFEGLMVRNLESPYELDKRSKHLQKVKTFIDEEFPIVGYYEATGNDRGTPIWECEAPNGRRFRARPMGTLAERRELWANRDAAIGRPLTVRFFEYTDDGVPRFPVGVAIRDYEGEQFDAESWMGLNLAGGVDEIAEMLNLNNNKKKDTKAAEAPLEDLSQDARYEIKIYVPSTQGDSDISDSEFEDRILFVQTALSTLFGGYTSVSADGGYIGASSELTSEPVGVVSTWATPEDYEEHLPKLEELLMYCRELWQQETIGFEFENDFFMYPEPTLFATEELSDSQVSVFYQIKYQETSRSEDGVIFTTTSDLDAALDEAENLLGIGLYRVEVYRLTRFMMPNNVLLNTDLIFAAKYDYWTTNTPSDAAVMESISRRFPNRRQQ